MVDLSTLRTPSKPRTTRIVAIGSLLSIAAFSGAYALLDRYRATQDREAVVDIGAPATGALTQRLRANLETLRATGAFLEATGDLLTQERFRAFARPLLERHPAVYALEWAPRVAREERADFQAAAARNRPNYGIWEPDLNGARKPAQDRQTLHPILYQEPGASALGLDVAFEPERRALIDRAYQVQDMVVSPPFELAELDGPDRYVAIYLPVGAARPGLAISVVNLTALLKDWAQPIERSGVSSWVEGSFGGELWGQPPAESNDRQWSETVKVGSETLTVGFVAPWGFGRGGAAAIGGSAAVLLLGLLATAVAVGLDRIRTLRAQIERARKLGQYVVEKELGKGAMGAVFLARHALMKRPTALKLMLSQDATSVARFEREVRLTCQLSHPNIIALYDYGRTDDGIFYYAMEYLPGLDLQSLLAKEGALTDGRAVQLLIQLVRGLREAHAAGLVHRDIKPGNMILTRVGTQLDVLKILDFGLVRPVEDADGVDRGRIAGTPLFMAPEAIHSPDEVGPATDVYAVGCVAFNLIAGRPPLGEGARNVNEILLAHVEQQPPRLNQVSKRPVSPELDEIVDHCLAKEANQRPSDDALLAALESVPIVRPWTHADAEKWWKQQDDRAAPAPADPPSGFEVTVLRGGR